MCADGGGLPVNFRFSSPSSRRLRSCTHFGSAPAGRRSIKEEPGVAPADRRELLG